MGKGRSQHRAKFHRTDTRSLGPIAFLVSLPLVFLGVIFVIIFLISVWIYIDESNLRQTLEDAEITIFAITDNNPQSSSSSSSSSSAVSMAIGFRVSSRNRNKLLGVRVWHMRIAAALDLPEDNLRWTEVGRAYVVPEFLQLPHETTHLRTTPILVSDFPLSSKATTALKDHVSSGFLPLRIYIKVRGQYKRVDGSWQTMVCNTGNTLCRFNVSLSTNASSNASHLQGAQCEWSVASLLYNLFKS